MRDMHATVRRAVTTLGEIAAVGQTRCCEPYLLQAADGAGACDEHRVARLRRHMCGHGSQPRVLGGHVVGCRPMATAMALWFWQAVIPESGGVFAP